MDKATNARLRALDERLKEIYSSAAETALKNKEKAIEKLAAFDPEALRKKGLSEEQIKTAGTNYKTQVDRSESISKDIARDIANTGEEARRIIENERLNIYDINYRGVLDSVEGQIGQHIDWAVYDKYQLKAILDGDFQPFDKVGVREVYVRTQRKGYVRERAYGRLGDDKIIVARLQNELSKSIVLGESIPKIATRIKAIGEMSRRQAVTIARTETLRAANAGRMLALEQANKEHGIEMLKKWISTNDTRTRPDHLEMQGVTAELDEPFVVGGEELMYPLDPNASAKNVVNCRCVMVSVLKGFSFTEESPKKEKNMLTNEENNGIIEAIKENISRLPDIQLGRSLGAKWKNYDITLPNGEIVNLTEGSRITNVQIIAGKGRNRKIDMIDSLVHDYGGNPDEWQKVKGLSYIDYNGESRDLLPPLKI